MAAGRGAEQASSGGAVAVPAGFGDSVTHEPDQEDIDWQHLYGPWEPLSPAGVKALLAGFEAPWWIVGGYAIEAFTQVPRPHEDVDLSIFGVDVPVLRRHLQGRYHLWSQDGGTLRPINDRFPEPLNYLSQIWIREHSSAPWIIDLPMTPSVDGLWQSKRDEGHCAPLDDVTWVHSDGIRYLNPEIVLLFKAVNHRPKDDRDLAVAWPLLSERQQDWLREAVARLYPDHAWSSWR